MASRKNTKEQKTISFMFPPSISFLGNFAWILFGGWLLALLYFLSGLLFCLTIIGIPFVEQLIALTLLSLFPFGKQITKSEHPNDNDCFTTIANCMWFILFGWELAVMHLICSLFFAITIVGLPFAKRHIRLCSLALMPFRYKIESYEDSIV